jgi:hypothetical protein
MKFNLLKSKQNRLPSLKTLRPPIFDVDLFWFSSLGIAFVVFIVTALIGFRLLYNQYFENYKQSVSTEGYENMINTDRLKSSIEKRVNFMNEKISLPKDPS